MNADFLLRHFDTLANTPDAVAKLRGLVLQLAVMGKLLPQDPSDEPASVLLKKIAAEKARLVRDKIRRSEPLPPIKPEDVPFDVPEGWEWVRLGDVILTDTGGGTPSKLNNKYWDGDIPWASVKDIGKSKFIVKTIDHITADGLANSSSNIIPSGCIIVCTRMGLGKLSINTVDMAINQDLRALKLSRHINIDFFYNFFLTQDVTGSGMTVKGIKRSELLMMPFPLPPLTEQHRIVARVDQLMALIDQLEQQRQTRRETRLRLNASALNALTTAPDAAAFHHAWGRIRDHFHRLYDHPQTVAQLRQAILQLAVMGKLVPQDPHDEPASALLKKIATEKARLVREGKIKRGETLPPVDPEDAPFELPGGWEWCRLGMLGNVKGGGTPSKQRPEYWEGDIPWISPKDMKVDFISDSIDHINDAAVDDSSVKMIEEGALLMVIRGMILDHSFPVAITTVDATINQDMKALELFIDNMQRYVLLVSKGSRDRFLALVQRSSHGTCRIESDRLFSLVIPLPPLPEQHRIVARVDQLMAVCDQLEEQLWQTQAHGARLMEAIVRNLSAA